MEEGKPQLNLNERAVRAKTDENEVNSLIAEYTPFLRASVRKYISGRDEYLFNDMFSIAQEAFLEAVKAYDQSKGHFIVFAGLVIKRRILNGLTEARRREGRETAFSALSARGKDGEEIEFDPPDERAQSFDNPYKWEIEAIKQEVCAYGIDFMKLAKYSPSAGKTKEACLSAVKYISGQQRLLSEMRRSGELPCKIICEATGIHRKTVERHRQYIIVVTVIAAGGYPYLSEWIGLRRESSKR